VCKLLFLIELQLAKDLSLPNRIGEYTINSSANWKSAIDGVSWTMTMPRSAAVYLDDNSTIPDEFFMKVEVRGISSIDYVCPVVKYLKFSLADIVDKKLVILVPLHLLKYREEVKKLNKDKELSNQAMRLKKTLYDDIIEAIKQSVNLGAISYLDGAKLMYRVGDMYIYLYDKYPELKRSDVEMESRWWEPEFIKQKEKLEAQTSEIEAHKVKIEMLEEYKGKQDAKIEMLEEYKGKQDAKIEMLEKTVADIYQQLMDAKKNGAIA
jgi:hypothetical protein